MPTSQGTLLGSLTFGQLRGELLSQQENPNARAAAGGIGLLGALLLIFAVVKFVGLTQAGSAGALLMGLAPLVILAVVFEVLSAPLVHYGYLSLALPTYLYAVFHHSGSPVGAIAVGLVVAIVPLLLRLVLPPASIETRLRAEILPGMASAADDEDVPEEVES